MTRKRHIRAVDDEAPFELAPENGVHALDGDDPSPHWLSANAGEDPAFAQYEDKPHGSFAVPRMWPALGALLISLWTIVFVAAHHPAISAGAPVAQWTSWLADWAVPVLLIVVAVLFALRNSTREAHRFGHAALALSAQSRELEQRLLLVNRELSLAREFLGAQTRDLDHLGRQASERLNVHSERLQSLIRDNSAEVEAIAAVSVTAVGNMERLRADLPVIANAARDVANQIGNAGERAHTALSDLTEGFDRLHGTGTLAEEKAANVRLVIASTLAEFEAQIDQLAQSAERRFATLAVEGESFRKELDTLEHAWIEAVHQRSRAVLQDLAQMSRDVAATEADAQTGVNERIDLIRERVTSLQDALQSHENEAVDRWNRRMETARERIEQAISGLARFDEKLADRQAAALEQEEASARALADWLARIDADLSARREQEIAHTLMLADHGDAIGEKMSELAGRMEDIVQHTSQTRASFEDHAGVMKGAITETTGHLAASKGHIERLTNASVRLLELIQAAAKHSRDDLPAALTDAEQRLIDLSDRSSQLAGTLDEAGETSLQLSDRVGEVDRSVKQVTGTIEKWNAKADEAKLVLADSVAGIRVDLAEVSADVERLSTVAGDALSGKVGSIKVELDRVLSELEQDEDQRIERFGSAISQRGADSIRRALDDVQESVLSELGAAAERAAQSGRNTVVQLREQLGRINELTGNLEARIARAREQSEQQVDNGFSRRIAHMTESLNSTAIDLDNLLSTDVSDSSWNAYLRGDKGIFTRRAVRLLSARDAKEIAALYQSDSEFREHVARYISDFEFMLRTVLSTREGNALGVTILSSDMGKLYVALAQATERLRT